MKLRENFKNNFKILKGGKISLVVSALMVGSITAHSFTISNTITSSHNVTADLSISQSGFITVSENDTIVNGAYGEDLNDIDIVNSGTIDVNSTGEDKINSAYAINIVNYSQTIDITNSGTINSSAELRAIAIASVHKNNASNDDEVFANDLNITSERDITIQNSGVINSTIQDSDSQGEDEIYSFAMGILFNGDGVRVENEGTINSTTQSKALEDNRTSAAGIVGAGKDIDIVNSGVIKATATEISEVRKYGDYDNDGGSSTIGIALGVDGYSDEDENVTNSTVVNSGEISSKSDTSSGISSKYIHESDITNSGTISSDGSFMSIGVMNGVSSSSNITNSGTITSESDFKYSSAIISKYGLNSTITNSGTISVDGNLLASGITLFTGEDSNITNSKTISVDSNISATGVSLMRSKYSNITNSKTISTDANYYSNSISITLGEDTTITNSGTITSNGDKSASAIGTSISMGADRSLKRDSKSSSTLIYSDIVNSGEMSAKSSSSAETISIGMGKYLTITNSGTISSDGNISSAISIANAPMAAGRTLQRVAPTSTFSNSNIINSGTINSDGDYSAEAISIGSGEDSNITNSGKIRATIDNELDYMAYALKGSGVNLVNESNGVIEGNIELNDGNLTNYGEIELPYNATRDLNNSAFAQVFINSGTLTIGLKTDGTTSTYSQLDSNGSITLNNSKLNINILDLNDADVYSLVGSTLEDIVIAGENNLTATNITTTDNSRYVDFQAVVDGDSLDLRVVGVDSDGDGLNDYEDSCPNQASSEPDGCYRETDLMSSSTENSEVQTDTAKVVVEESEVSKIFKAELLNEDGSYSDIVLDTPKVDETTDTTNLNKVLTIKNSNVETKIETDMGSDIKVRIDGSFEATKSLNDESDTKLSIKGDKKGKIEASLQSSSAAGQGSKSTIKIPNGAKTKITKEGSILSETEMLNEDGSASLKVEISLSKDRGAQAVITSTKGERIVVKNYDGSEESIMSFIEAENINRAIGEDNRYKGVKNTFKSSTSFFASESSLSRSTDYSEAKTVEIIPMSAWQRFEEVTLFSGERSITLLLGSADIVIDGDRSTMIQNEEYLLPLDIESVDINQTIEDNQTIVAKDGNLSLSSDWNLVSLPVDTNATTSDFNALTIWKFNSEWIKNPETILSGEGFWVKKDTPETISFTGDSYTQDFSNIVNGWNLLGTGETLSNATEYGLIWKYNLNSGWIKNPETILSGEGFWLKK